MFQLSSKFINILHNDNKMEKVNVNNARLNINAQRT